MRDLFKNRCHRIARKETRKRNALYELACLKTDTIELREKLVVADPSRPDNAPPNVFVPAAAEADGLMARIQHHNANLASEYGHRDEHCQLVDQAQDQRGKKEGIVNRRRET